MAFVKPIAQRQHSRGLAHGIIGAKRAGMTTEFRTSEKYLESSRAKVLVHRCNVDVMKRIRYPSKSRKT